MSNNDLHCTVCDKSIVRDSVEHDHCMLVNHGWDLICHDCPFVCKTKCGDCVICEEALIDPYKKAKEDHAKVWQNIVVLRCAFNTTEHYHLDHG